MQLSILSVAYPFARVTHDTVGGAEQILARLDRALVEHHHRSLVIATEGSKTAGRLFAVPQPPGLIDDATRALTHEAVRTVLARLHEHEPVDLIHMHGVDFASYLPTWTIPVIVTLHLPLELYPMDALRAARPELHLIPVSRSQAAAAPAGLYLLPPIENGVPPPAPVRHARRRYALAMGRICPEKNFAAALDAARIAGSPLLLAGQVYPYLEHVSYFATEIRPRLDGARRWLGPIAGPRKQRLLAGACCLLVPSRAAETSSLVAMEALAAGTPVIAYRCGALPEVVEHGRTGFIVDDVPSMADAIRGIDQIDPQACRRAARERFPLERMISAYLSLYERVARSFRHRGAPRPCPDP